MKLRLLSLAMVLASISSQNASAQDLIGITQDDKLFTMASIGTPGVVTTPIAVTGMTAGQTIVGADYRPLTGELYILGYNAATNAAQLYTLNTTTGVATAVGATTMTLMLGTNSSIGFDFNPTVDRIRVVGANKKNYRLIPALGTIAATDTDLAFAGSDINAPSPATIGAVAYTNSYVGSNTTTLYNYDQVLNVLTLQNPPNNGTLNTVGPSGIVVNAITHSIDMDIYMDPVTLNNVAYLAANTGAAINDNLYTVNLTTGAATTLGQIGGGLDVKNIAIPLNRTLPAVSGKMVYGIQANTNTLISFDSDNPRLIRSYKPVTGLTTGQNIAGLDFRPSNGQLYAFGYDNIMGNYQLYIINTGTGAAAPVNPTAIAINLGVTNNVGFDFNPMVDRIRVTSRTNGNSIRLNPDDGTIAAMDATLIYATGDVNDGKVAHIGAVAYTNSYMGATSTELFGIDDSLGALVQLAAPNTGSITTNVAAFYSANLNDMTTDIDFFYDSVSTNNIGYMSANTVTSVNDKFYTVTTSGTLSLVSDIGLGMSVSDIAVQPQYKNATVGIANVYTGKKQFTVYPNPATDELYIKSDGVHNNATVSITDITGRVVKTLQLTQASISIADLQKGVYFVSLIANGEVYQTQKVVKQ